MMAIRLRQIVRYFSTAVLATSMLAPVAFTVGCAARVSTGRYYDRDHRDYHNWNDNEEREYRLYLGERHEDYRDFHKLNRNEQNNYWKWRHDHPDRDDRDRH